MSPSCSQCVRLLHPPSSSPAHTTNHQVFLPQRQIRWMSLAFTGSADGGVGGRGGCRRKLLAGTKSSVTADLFCCLFVPVSDVPRNFSVNLATKTSVLLTWEFPEGSNPYRFTVGAARTRDGALTWWKLDFQRNLSSWLKILMNLLDLLCSVYIL